MNKTTRVICPKPFSRTHLGHQYFVPCCRSWLTKEYLDITRNDNSWGGHGATLLREKILKGDYSFCRTDLCKQKLVPVDDISLMRENISFENIRRIQSGSPDISGPTIVKVSSDPRCNLACSSCRSSHIFEVSEQEQKNINQSDAEIRRYADTIQEIYLAGDGEVFFSPWMRNLVKNIEEYNLKNFMHFRILTNGLLFDQKTYDILLPGSSWIKKVTVSIDAGNEVTYNEIRGGDWRRLLDNIKWMMEMRKNLKFNQLSLNFTLRRDNLNSVLDFVQLGIEYDVDDIQIVPFYKWSRMSIENEDEQCVHLPNHPEFNKYQTIKKQAKKLSKNVSWNIG